MADTLRGSMDAAEYKHVVLGLIFLKYISDAFEEMHARLEAERAEGADPEDRDEYTAKNIFWVPPEARWSHLKAQARQPTIGQLVDGAMAGIERDNPALKDVLPKDYARPALDKDRLGQLIDRISNIKVGDADARSQDVIGRVYEYFLSQFASAEGKKGGEFYTPRSGRQAPGQDAGALSRPGLRPLLRLVRHVRAVGRVHRRARHRQRQQRESPESAPRPISAIYGQESNHTTLAARQNEPRHPRHRRADRPRRQLPQRPPSRPQGRLHPRQSAVQRLGLGRRSADRRQALAIRRPAQGQRQLRLGAAHGSSPRAGRRGRLRSRQRLHVVQPVGRGRPSART